MITVNHSRRQFTYLNDGERVALNRESESGIGGNVDHSEPVALSRLDVDPSAHDLRASIVSSDTIDEATVRDLFEVISDEIVLSYRASLQVRHFLREISPPFPGQPERPVSHRDKRGKR